MDVLHNNLDGEYARTGCKTVLCHILMPNFDAVSKVESYISTE